MVSNDDAIPEQVLSAVDAFLPKDEAASHLLPVIVSVCGEDRSALQEGAGSPAQE
jgi:hypothetical protein